MELDADADFLTPASLPSAAESEHLDRAPTTPDRGGLAPVCRDDLSELFNKFANLLKPLHDSIQGVVIKTGPAGPLNETKRLFCVWCSRCFRCLLSPNFEKISWSTCLVRGVPEVR